jgi:hypothetical protein
MAGVLPAMAVLLAAEFLKTWMPGIKPGMTSNYFIILLAKP